MILINLLSYLFNDTLMCVFLLTIVINSWYIYYITVNDMTAPAIQSKDVKKPKLIDLTKSIRSAMNGCLLLWVILINYVFILNGPNSNIFCDNIYFSHNNITYLYLVLLLLMFILLGGSSLVNQNISFLIEYIIFIVLIIINSYLLISSTNFFLTIFLLELVALLIFAKMSVSKIIIKKSVLGKVNMFSKTQFSYGLFNSLFFQFWANFISSICLFFALLNIHYMCGTSNFFVINFLLYIISYNWQLTNIFVGVILIAATTGLFIKLGLAPYQFFKIETYKGIPVFIVVIYTVLYLFSYIYLFLFLFLFQITALREFTGLYILFFLAISILYLISLLFDTKNFKAFLSYSTLITISNIFLIILVL